MKLPLSTWRNLAHMTQIEFAKAVGVDKSTAYMWESGRTKPQARNIAKIEQVLNIKWSENVERKGVHK